MLKLEYFELMTNAASLSVSQKLRWFQKEWAQIIGDKWTLCLISKEIEADFISTPLQNT